MDFELDLGLLASVGAGGLTVIIALLLLSLLYRHDRIKNFANAVPVLIDALRAFITEAELKHSEIMEEYAEQAEAENKDPRLLWVIDRAEEFAKKRLGITIDINWLISHIEHIVSENKRKQ